MSRFAVFSAVFALIALNVWANDQLGVCEGGEAGGESCSAAVGGENRDSSPSAEIYETLLKTSDSIDNSSPPSSSSSHSPEREAMCKEAADFLSENSLILTREQINEFIETGVLVVKNVLTTHEINLARDGLHARLNYSGVDYWRLGETAENLYHIGSGVGGIVEVFYDEWKLPIMQHPKLFSIMSQIWRATYAEGNIPPFEHPYGKFNPDLGFIYVDRAGFRIPDEIISRFGLNSMGWPLQFGINAHFDADILNLFSAKQRSIKEGRGVPPRWRPIQSFVSLTDSSLPHRGGFEAAKGFHYQAEYYFREKPFGTGSGEYFSLMKGVHDDIIDLIEHIPVGPGDFVLWDWRIP